MLLQRVLLSICISFVYLAQPAGAIYSAQENSLVVLNPSEIRFNAAKIVVRIDGTVRNNDEEIVQSFGSGFIVKKDGSNYTVLTSAHVVRNSIAQSLTTQDGRQYSFKAKNIKFFSGVDLAEITFRSSEIYEVARLTQNADIPLSSRVHYFGWNAPSKTYPVRAVRFSSGVIEQVLPVNRSYNGYSLVFNLTTVPGISGSPLFNDDGEVIGIYGLGDNRDSTLGISIATYQKIVARNARDSQRIPFEIPSSVDTNGLLRGSLKGTFRITPVHIDIVVDEAIFRIDGDNVNSIVLGLGYSMGDKGEWSMVESQRISFDFTPRNNQFRNFPFSVQIPINSSKISFEQPWLVIGLVSNSGKRYTYLSGDRKMFKDLSIPQEASEINTPPTQLSPRDNESYDIYPRITELGWSDVPNAVEYGLEVDVELIDGDTHRKFWGSESRAGWEYSYLIRTKKTSYTLSYVGANRGRWRAWGIDKAGNAGPKSSWRIFSHAR
jgi:V8-like Glu-specific endopeptidase